MKDLVGKSYRLLQNNLDKDIVPEESKILIKKDKVIIKLQKVREGARCPIGRSRRALYRGWQQQHTNKCVLLSFAIPRFDVLL